MFGEGVLRWVLIEDTWHLTFDGLVTVYSHFEDRIPAGAREVALAEHHALDPYTRCLECRRHVAWMVGLER